jgi:AcrR family transcriptional regulator
MSHREALLGAARRLVIERGFAATTARDLARKAHAPLGAVNYHFNSKDDVLVLALVDMIEAWVEEPLAAAEAAAADGHSAAQQLKAAEQAAASRLAERPLEAAAFLEGVALAARRPEIRDVLERRLDASARRLQQLVERSGVVAGAAEQQQLGHALVALHDGFAIQAALGRPPEVSVVALLQAAAGRSAGTLQAPGPQP